MGLVRRLAWAGGPLLGGVAAVAQIGDRVDPPGLVQESPVPRERVPPAPVVPVADAVRRFEVAPGLRVLPVASEPLVGDPVAMEFGEDGRLWVVEMRGYMHDVDGAGEDLKIGRVVTLRDTDGDGVMDASTVFADDLIMPRAILLLHDGVLVGAPPHLYFMRDVDGDGRADERTVVASDFGVAVDPKRPELANPERAPNGLIWGRDNWIYGAAYDVRLRRDAQGVWRREPTYFRGQWGLSQNDEGDLFYNSNSDQLRADLIPYAYLARQPRLPAARGTNVKVAASQVVWPMRVNPGVNRGYQPGTLRMDGRLSVFTAACAPMIYRGDALPAEFYGNAFVAEPAGNFIKRNLLTAHDGTLEARDAYEQREVLASPDERFRPVFLANAPDGALYVVDFYRGILQHRISLTSYLRNQILERGLQHSIGLGRVYRLVGTGPAPQRASTPATTADWIARLSHPNGWWRDRAQQRLVERRDPAAIAPLRQLAISGDSPLGRLGALWTLEGMEGLEPPLLAKALRDSDPRVRVAAVRLSEATLRTAPRAAEALRAELHAVLANETDPRVQRQWVLSLGEVRRNPSADAAAQWRVAEDMADLVTRFSEVHFMADAAISGLAGLELPLLEKLSPASSAAPAPPGAALDRLRGLLAAAVFNAGNEAAAARALEWLTSPGAAERQALRLAALVEGTEETAAAPRAEQAPTFAAWLAEALQASAPPADAPSVKVVGGDRDAAGATPGVTKPSPTPQPFTVGAAPSRSAAFDAAPATDRTAQIRRVAARLLWSERRHLAVRSLTAVEKELSGQGGTIYALNCLACHQSDGRGREGLAPPLAGSEWVEGSPERLVRIVTHGLTGPIQVRGQTYQLDMPAFGFLNDDQVAGLLTFVRRSWGHTAEPIAPALVKRIRAEISSRNRAWTSVELLAVP